MALELNKLRGSGQYNLASSGSETATFIHVYGTSNRSVTRDTKIVIANPQGGWTTMTPSTNTNGWWLVAWEWRASQTGFPLGSAVYNREGLDARTVWTVLQDIRSGTYGSNIVWALASQGRVESNSDLLSEMTRENRSQYWYEDMPSQVGNIIAYSAIGTSSLGIISESLQNSLQHADAFVEAHIESDTWSKIGWAGYGPDLLGGDFIVDLPLPEITTANTSITIAANKQRGSRLWMYNNADPSRLALGDRMTYFITEGAQDPDNDGNFNIIYDWDLQPSEVGTIFYFLGIQGVVQYRDNNGDTFVTDPDYRQIIEVEYMGVSGTDLNGNPTHRFLSTATDYSEAEADVLVTLGYVSLYPNYPDTDTPVTNDISSTNENNKYYVKDDEWVRLSGEVKIPDAAAKGGGSLQISLGQGTSTVSYTSTSNEFEYFELWYRNSSTAGSLEVDVTYSSGTTVDGNLHQVRGLQMYRAGFDGDSNSSHDVIVSESTLVGRDIVESIGPFNLAKPSEFLTFWSDRNRNLYLPHNQTSFGSGFAQSSAEPVQWFNQKINFTGSTDPQRAFRIELDGSSNRINITNHMAANNVGIGVDHTKCYYAGWWVRVHDWNGSRDSRIQVLAQGQNSSGTAVPMDDKDGTTIATNTGHALMSVTMDAAKGQGRDTKGWKLYGGFYLPSWMSNAQLADWYTNYWGQWAGHYNLEEGIAPLSEGFSGSLATTSVNSRMAYLARMTTGVTRAATSISFESAQAGETGYIEIAYPFMIEIDPMNVKSNGDIFLWDFTEQTMP